LLLHDFFSCALYLNARNKEKNSKIKLFDSFDVEITYSGMNARVLILQLRNKLQILFNFFLFGENAESF
jgi:hypothetical protein